MRLSKQTEKEALQVYDIWLQSYLNGDVATYDSHFDDDYHFIGSTDNEEFLSRKDTTKFFEKTADQLAGKCDLRKETRILEQFGELVFITHVFDAWFLNGTDYSYYGRFRFTNILRENKDGWRFIYQHFSTPDSKTEEGETIGFDRINTENQELREAIKRRTVELEEKNRELKMEASLERVRSRSLAMHKTDELQEVVRVVAQELKNTGVILDTWGAVICTYFQDSKDVLHWTAAEDPANPSIAFLLPYFKDELYDEAWASKDRGDSYFAKVFSFEVKNAFFNHAFEHSDYRQLPDGYKNVILGSESHGIAWAWSKNSAIMIPSIQGDLPSDEEKEILIRFAKVFEQAFIRFLDLQKAEAQVREAQIETALERIRSQATSMQQSTDLLDVVVTMRNEFIRLGHEAHYFWHMLWSPDKYEKAMTSGDGTRIGFVMELPRHIHGNIPLLANWEKSDAPTAVYPMDVDAALDYVHKMISLGDFKNIDPNAPSDDDIRHIGGLTFIMARTAHGEIGYSLPGAVANPPAEDLDILVRFARAFDLAHRRFLDLQKAEEQARETQIELALEKVRNRTMAMQHSDELPEAANHLFLEIQALGLPAASAGYCIWENEDKKSSTAFVSSIGELQKPFSLPTKGIGYDFYNPMLNGEKFHVEELHGQRECAKHYAFMRTLPVFGEVLDGLFEAGFQIPDFQVFHIVYFSQGYLMFITREPVPHAYDIFKRCGNVFEQTYTRFLDLQTKEEQAKKLLEEKQRLEKTLHDLRITQKQLIQSEKMASLGELTAGIAHEIQNPLNFVNNFSEVSMELLDEMKEEMENGGLDEAKAIAHDLQLNLKKINHHGQRADAIVKGMLQHSRKSAGEKTPTDINKLADEYLRLAYHGLRAKDKSFNAALHTDFDPALEPFMVIPQDIGRVLLNLITNAFYACTERSRSAEAERSRSTVHEKKKSNGADFQPAVTISTRKFTDHITIAVKDNGNGIPQQDLDKIFQPFFTTKPTGEGTGLGLSLSYDVVKAHGGEIKVESEINEGTVFTILLPISTE